MFLALYELSLLGVLGNPEVSRLYYPRIRGNEWAGDILADVLMSVGPTTHSLGGELPLGSIYGWDSCGGAVTRVESAPEPGTLALYLWNRVRRNAIG